MFGSKSLTALSGLILILTLYGCNKDEAVAPDQNLVQKKLSQITIDEGNYSSFEYQGDKLFKYEVFNESERTLVITLHYDGGTKPVSEDCSGINGEFQKKYYYDSFSRLDSVLLLQNINSSGYEGYGYLKYYYNNLNQIISTEQYNSSDQIMFTTAYTYDTAGNLTKTHMSGDNGFDETAVMQYDNKINPWYDLKDNFFYESAISPNNLSGYTRSTNQSQTTTSDYKYTYDSDGYPITCTIISTYGTNIDTLNEVFGYR